MIDYIFHTSTPPFGLKGKKKTIFRQTNLDSATVAAIFQIINHSGILTLPIQREIDGWPSGCDGITYHIEYTDKNEYWFKNYWTPRPDSPIKEERMVSSFVKEIYDLLELKEKREFFEGQLPKRGCYNWSSMSSVCYTWNFSYIGYYGSTKLPLGCYSSSYFGYVGKLKTSVGLGFSYRSDSQQNYDLSLYAGKSYLIFNNKKLSDCLSYDYCQRKLDFVEEGVKYQNHKIIYNINISEIANFGSGIDYLSRESDEIGMRFYAGKWIPKWFSITTDVSIFSSHVDYKIGAIKSFYLRNAVFWFNVGLYNEKFMNCNDWSVLLMVGF